VNATLKAPNISVAVKGLGSLDANTLPAAARGLQAGLDHARGVAMRKFLSGPRPDVLDVVTTRLRGSISTAVKIENGTVRGSIGSNLVYAPVHEFGLVGHAPVRVKAHLRAEDADGYAVEKIKVDKKGRRSSKLYRFGADGSIVGYKQTLLKLAASTGAIFNIGAQVDVIHRGETWRKKFKYKGRPFLRPAIEQSSEQIGRYIRRELAALKPA